MFDHNISAIEAATRLGYNDIVELLLRDASPTQRLLAVRDGEPRRRGRGRRSRRGG